jgi:hypothetical protein
MNEFKSLGIRIESYFKSAILPVDKKENNELTTIQKGSIQRTSKFL